MDINKVIQQGDIPKLFNGWFTLPTFIIFIVIFVLIVITFLFLIITGVCDSDEISLPTVMVVLVLLCAGLITHDNQKDEYNNKISEWRSTYAKPYIESLPKEKKEIVFIKIDPELGAQVSINKFWLSGYTKVSSEERTPVTVSFKDNGIKTRTDWYETHMELTKEEKPFIEFQRLTKNLGNKVNAGLYNVKIYIPESYKFNDIK
ncbi:hypothetical protein ABE82_26130 (plasmid) [Paenibacillus peoriae]|uniref:hypothetical protein n=1 Tax=Paenibacillus peoriae TaxID=59893 RepID=UPI000720E232|nr:hypothetical protein [Paenibacillus peoriae]ALS09900.1 hypothetical protein ABE82_26130 [Paenibacillus peoriae]